jgi:hypothetical protein
MKGPDMPLYLPRASPGQAGGAGVLGSKDKEETTTELFWSVFKSCNHCSEHQATVVQTG